MVGDDEVDGDSYRLVTHAASVMRARSDLPASQRAGGWLVAAHHDDADFVVVCDGGLVRPA